MTLSDETVIAIYTSGDVQKRIAAKFGVSIGTVSMIKSLRRREEVVLKHLSKEMAADRVRAENAALATRAFCPGVDVTEMYGVS